VTLGSSLNEWYLEASELKEYIEVREGAALISGSRGPIDGSVVVEILRI